jgi:hypothetical protein
MQTNLHSFFTIVTAHNEQHKKCFIYDPATYKAYFSNKPDDHCDFVSIKSGIKLYIVKDHSLSVKDSYPSVHTNANIPLLKSNLQKAIRRGNHIVAVSSALAILQREPIQLLRRLPIIFVEDVCIIDSFPIVIWLLMADKQYKMTNRDIDILLQIVYSLCVCSKYFDDRQLNCQAEYTHELLETNTCYNEVLSLHYRRLYGGMKGDMQLLKNAISHYENNPSNIVRYSFIEQYPFEIGLHVPIIKEAIDFHPYPNMLESIHKKIQIDKTFIKTCIWFAESGFNVRKQYTIDLSHEYKNKQEYHLLVPHLEQFRLAYLLD